MDEHGNIITRLHKIECDLKKSMTDLAEPRPQDFEVKIRLGRHERSMKRNYDGPSRPPMQSLASLHAKQNVRAGTGEGIESVRQGQKGASRNVVD